MRSAAISLNICMGDCLAARILFSSYQPRMTLRILLARSSNPCGIGTKVGIGYLLNGTVQSNRRLPATTRTGSQSDPASSGYTRDLRQMDEGAPSG